MDGFQDGVPVKAKVTWASSEVELSNGKATPFGLLAEIPSGTQGAVTRYLVPWTAVAYLKQDIPAPPSSDGPVTVPSGGGGTTPPPSDSGRR